MINIVRKGFAHIPDEVKHCPVCGKYEQFYRLEGFRSDNPNLMACQHTGDFIQKYPTFTCDNCKTIWQYLGE